MNTKKDILEIAKQSITIESKAIANLINFLNKNFENVVKFILKSKERVIIARIDKSANIASKIVATLNSTDIIENKNILAADDKKYQEVVHLHYLLKEGII